jgi:poly(3-hydroxybutyrate) depolymerase
VVPFGGGLLTTGPANQVPRQLAQIRGCAAEPQTSRLNSNTTCQTFSGCAGGGIVQMCTIQGGNHVLYPFVGQGDEQPDFDTAFENLLEQAAQLRRTGAQ